MPWLERNVVNIAYSMHPYQHGSCCGQIGDTRDLSMDDPFQSAFCLFPPRSPSGFPVASQSVIPIPGTKCDSTGTTTQNKKTSPCIWAPNAIILTPLPSSFADCKILNVTNIGGHDINNGAHNLQPSPAECCQSCQNTSECVGWTYVPGNFECWLKNQVSTPYPDEDVISGYPGTREYVVKTKGVCAGDKIHCTNLNEFQCKSVNWNSPSSGGWSKYALPMAYYGPVIATDHGSFDCSSAFEYTLTSWMSKFGISYTARVLLPQNSGSSVESVCGYPSMAFGKGIHDCVTSEGCTAILEPKGWSGKVVFNDIQKNVITHKKKVDLV